MARTKAATRKATSSKSATVAPPNPVPLGAYSIAAFCVAHDLSEDFFYKLMREGRGPQVMRVGARTLVSIEAAAEWRREMERASATIAPAP
jgi:hypothetical protein